MKKKLVPYIRGRNPNQGKLVSAIRDPATGIWREGTTPLPGSNLEPAKRSEHGEKKRVPYYVGRDPNKGKLQSVFRDSVTGLWGSQRTVASIPMTETEMSQPKISSSVGVIHQQPTSRIAERVGLFDEPGWQGKVMVGNTLVYYYVPVYTGAPRTREFLLSIHSYGSGAPCRWENARDLIHRSRWKHLANEKNVIIIAPVFGVLFPPQDLLKDADDWPIMPHAPRLWEENWVPEWCSGPPDYPEQDDLGYNHPPHRPPQTYEEKCRYYKLHKNAGVPYNQNIKFYRNYKSPDDFPGYNYLYDYQRILNEDNFQRSDEKANEIIDLFRAFFPDVAHAFNIYGYSGGCQFVSRYMMLFPYELNRVVMAAGGSYMFPLDHAMFPDGFTCQIPNLGTSIKLLDFTYKPDSFNTLGLAERFDKTHVPSDWVEDLLGIGPHVFNHRLKHVFERLHVLIRVGDRDILPDLDQPERDWMGLNHKEKANNYFVQMSRKHSDLLGGLPKPENFRFQFAPGDHGTARRHIEETLCDARGPRYPPSLWWDDPSQL
jgi:hypothetical protein